MQDRCTALVFRPGDRPRNASGGLLASFGFGAATAASRAAEVTLLLQNGRVAYKMITGVPPSPKARQSAPMQPRSAALMPVAYRTLN